jgi:hypothetical protein
MTPRPRLPYPRYFPAPCAAPSAFVGARLAVPVCAVSTGPPRYFVSVASKGLSVLVSRLFAIVTGKFVSVASKGLKLTVGVGDGHRMPCPYEASGGRLHHGLCSEPRAVVGAQFIAPFSPRLPLNLRLSPVTSNESPVANLPSRVTA